MEVTSGAKYGGASKDWSGGIRGQTILSSSKYKFIAAGSLVVFLVGILALALSLQSTEDFLIPMDPMMSDFRIPTNIGLFIGVLAITTGVFGCIALLRPNEANIITFFLGVLAVLISLGVLFLITMTADIKVKKEIAKKKLYNGVVSYYRDLDAARKLDMIHETLQCCGFDSYKDWSKKSVFNCSLNTGGGTPCNVPESCCKPNLYEDVVKNCTEGVLDSGFKKEKIESLIYTKGCSTSMEKVTENFLFRFQILSWILFMVVGSLVAIFVFTKEERECEKEGIKHQHLPVGRVYYTRIFSAWKGCNNATV